MEFAQFIIETEFRFEGKTVGVITAYNPQAKKIPLAENRKLNKKLWNELRASGFDPWAIKGNYKGKSESSFLVPDISRADIVKYAKKYNQEAVVWAKKANEGYDVEWIEDGKTTKKQKIASIRSLVSQTVTF